jgi:tripartite motif-containing protein 71
LTLVEIHYSHFETFDIFFSLLEPSFIFTDINTKTKWRQYGTTVAGGNRQGSKLNQLDTPSGLYVDDEHQCIYIADYENHRVVEWKYDTKHGQVVIGRNGHDHRILRLNRPRDVIVDKRSNSVIISDRKNRRVVQWFRQNEENGQIIISDIDCFGLAMDNNGYLYVSDCKKNEVGRWRIGDKHGIIVAGGNGHGHNLNQLSFPTFITVDQDYSVYVSDSSNNRVMKWLKGAKEGIVVMDEEDEENTLAQVSDPQGVIVDHLGNVYVADSGNNRVLCWSPVSKEVRIIVGGNEYGRKSNQLSDLGGLSFDREGNLYVVDCGNDRIQKFSIDS